VCACVRQREGHVTQHNTTQHNTTQQVDHVELVQCDNNKRLHPCYFLSRHGSLAACQPRTPPLQHSHIGSRSKRCTQARAASQRVPSEVPATSRVLHCVACKLQSTNTETWAYPHTGSQTCSLARSTRGARGTKRVASLEWTDREGGAHVNFPQAARATSDSILSVCVRWPN
jgi:hypothetical protein